MSEEKKARFPWLLIVVLFAAIPVGYFLTQRNAANRANVQYVIDHQQQWESWRMQHDDLVGIDFIVSKETGGALAIEGEVTEPESIERLTEFLARYPPPNPPDIDVCVVPAG